MQQLDGFISWLQEALDSTENWTQPRQELDSLGAYLDTHLVRVHTHTRRETSSCLFSPLLRDASGSAASCRTCSDVLVGSDSLHGVKQKHLIVGVESFAALYLNDFLNRESVGVRLSLSLSPEFDSRSDPVEVKGQEQRPCEQ